MIKAETNVSQFQLTLFISNFVPFLKSHTDQEVYLKQDPFLKGRVENIT